VGMHEPTVVRVEFHDHGARTRMTLSDGPYPAGREHAEAGWSAAFNKLETLVAS
jgi:Activator of Hsp90 ATPase homolog 1-like protein